MFDLVYAFPWQFDHMKLLLLRVMYVQGQLIVCNKSLLYLRLNLWLHRWEGWFMKVFLQWKEIIKKRISFNSSIWDNFLGVLVEGNLDVRFAITCQHRWIGEFFKANVLFTTIILKLRQTFYYMCKNHKFFTWRNKLCINENKWCKFIMVGSCDLFWIFIFIGKKWNNLQNKYKCMSKVHCNIWTNHKRFK